ncbi:response regulator [Ekhidna sp. To15]|uniref:response regulator n=1 Tax=Ekhidna sp. To15 TaxID=3395267 RepID=UPI003F5275E0
MSSDLHILLIDDDPTVNYLNKIIIEKSNITATISESTHAEDAIEQLANGNLNPSLILLDLNMPIMDGWQFVEQFQKLPNLASNTKIIILSSSINPLDIEKASNVSVVSDYFCKPLSMDNLKEIEKILSN